MTFNKFVALTYATVFTTIFLSVFVFHWGVDYSITGPDYTPFKWGEPIVEKVN